MSDQHEKNIESIALPFYEKVCVSQQKIPYCSNYESSLKVFCKIQKISHLATENVHFCTVYIFVLSTKYL